MSDEYNDGMALDDALNYVLGGGESESINPIGISKRISELPIKIRNSVGCYFDRVMTIPLPELNSLSEIG